MSREDMERTAAAWLDAFNSGDFAQMRSLVTPGASFVADSSDDALLDKVFGPLEARDGYGIVAMDGDIVTRLQLAKRNTPTILLTLESDWFIDENRQTVAGKTVWSRPEDPDQSTSQGRLAFRLSLDSDILSCREQHEAIFMNSSDGDQPAERGDRDNRSFGRRGHWRCPCC